MLPEILVFGHTIRMYNFFMICEYISVPIVLISLRKRYGLSLINSIFYAFLTLVLGVIALNATIKLQTAVLTNVSDGVFEPFEKTSSYGYWVFISPLLLIFCLWLGVNFRKISDYIAPSVCLVTSIGKLCCFFNGCCEGPASEHGIYMSMPGCKVMPVQLYEVLVCGANFALAILLTKTLSEKHPGFIMPITGIIYAIQKIIWEHYRHWDNGWVDNFLNTGHSYWQFFELITLFGCLLWLILVFILEKKDKQPCFEKILLKLNARKLFDKLEEKLVFPKD